MTAQPELTRRRLLLGSLASAAGASAFVPSVLAAAPAATLPHIPPPTGDLHDFDFFVGDWTGANRRLKKRWVGSDDWDEFPNTLTCGSQLSGVVNLDYYVHFPTKGWSGMTLRTFDVEDKRWSLYWINSRNGKLFPPVVGGFSGDRGEFFGDDVDEGRPVKVRFRWTRHRPGAARWEQAFSLDGRDWETNWICEHTRVSDRPSVCAPAGAEV